MVINFTHPSHPDLHDLHGGEEVGHSDVLRPLLCQMRDNRRVSHGLTCLGRAGGAVARRARVRC